MATKPSGKILRFGVLQNGRIIEERLMRKRRTVTVGESPKATIIVSSTEGKPAPKNFPIFVDKKTHYELSFTESMAGILTVDGSVAKLNDLRKSNRVRKRGATYRLELGELARGMVNIGDVMVIFQFVQAPPIPVRPKLPASIRGGWIKSID